MLYCTASSWFVKTKEGANHFVPEVIQKHFDTEVNTSVCPTLPLTAGSRAISASVRISNFCQAFARVLVDFFTLELSI